MIEQVVPRAAVSAEAFDDEVPALPLAMGEDRGLPPCPVPGRREEYTTGRALARSALGRLGLAPVAVLRDAVGAPVWPAGVVGSLTHCAGYRAAVVARAAEVPVLGVDAEPALPLPDGVLPVVALSDERLALRRLARSDPGVQWDRLLLCAKEAVYKAWYPLTGRWLDFADVRVVFRRHGGLTATLLAPGPVLDGVRVGAFCGRWLARDGLLVVVVADWRPARSQPLTRVPAPRDATAACESPLLGTPAT
jgi:enterobactin synthetase component D / holo-[acyl-carrier protein] synthase